MSAAVRTACPYCGVGCGIVVERDEGRLALRGDPDHPANRGRLCSKGRALLHTALARSDRLLHPELRETRDQPRGRVGWDEAIARVAARFAAARAEHGPDAVALYISGQCLTEEYYLAAKLARGVLGTNNVDTNSRLCMSSAVAAYKATLGADSVPGCYEDLDVCDTALIAGSNMAWCHPVLFRRLEARKAADPERVRLITVDPRRTATAAASDLHLAIRPGTDVALFHALAHCLRANGDVDRAFVDRHCTGWPALARRLDEWPPERAAAVCGVPAADIRRAAAWLGGGRRFMTLWTMGLNQSATGTDKGVALINLSLITGTVGKQGCGPFSLTGQPNAMGGREVGGMATLLHAHRSLASAADRAAVEDAWGVPAGTIPAQPGLTAIELFDACASGRIQALWIIATNPAGSLPDGGAVAAALRACPFVVVQDAHPTETTAFADVVLPAAAWLEKTGSMTNSERRVHLVEALVEPPGEARPDWLILRDVARALGAADLFPYATPAEVYAEHAALTAGTDCDVSGLSHAALRTARAVQWPAPVSAPAGRARLFADGVFAHADGRARLGAPDWEDRSEPLDGAHPLVLTTGRLRDQWHLMTRTGQVARLNASDPQPFCEIAPADAAARGIEDGAVVEVRSRRGAVRLPAKATADIRPGVVFLPMHWGPKRGGAHGHVNALTSPRTDPVSREPDLKYAAVEVARFRPAPRAVVVVGAGASALAFTEAMATACPQDRLTVLGDEPEAFYDRVALPHWIAGDRAWDTLRRTPAATRATIRAGVRVDGIDRAARAVLLADGSRVRYDVLVLATGSRAAMPWSGPRPAQGVLGLRRRSDAEAIVAAAVPGAPIVIVGAGLLAVELADALVARGARPTLLARGTRLMGRQLDAIAADHLAAALRRKGVAIRCSATVAAIEGAAQPDAVRLADGATLPAALVVFATGTEADTALARAAGLPCGQGVAVDRNLVSADPAILAVGECAEHDGRRAGTTAECRRQVAAAVEALRGNPHAPFRWRPAPAILKVRDLALASIGEVEEQPGDEVIALHDPARRRYWKCVVRGDRLVGALALGDTAPFAGWSDLVEHGLELDDEGRDRLLTPGAAAAPVEGALVCSCRGVGDGSLRRAIAGGCRDLSALCAATGAGTACGSCRPEVARLLATVPPSP